MILPILRFSNPLSSVEIAIVNLSGQVVFQQSYNNIKGSELNTSELTQGVYFIKIKTPAFLSVLKLIKK